MDPIHQAIAWLALAQQIEHEGEPLWSELKAVFDRHHVEIDVETLDLIVAAGIWRKTLLAQHDATNGE
jgi:hypothetical protein